MKVVLVLCACIAGSLAGLLGQQVEYNRNAEGAQVGGYGDNSVRAADVLKDSRRSNDAAKLWANNGVQAGRRGTTYGDDANRSAWQKDGTSNDFGQNAAASDVNEDAASRASGRDSQWSQAQNEWNTRDSADRAAANNLWEEGNKFRQGKRNHDGIDYAFDKKFNTRNHEDGGYEYSESSDSHALDDYADRKSLYDKKRSDHVAQAAKADAQSADREASNSNKAAASQASADKFGRDYDSNSWAKGTNKDHQIKGEEARGGNRYWQDASDRALDAYNDLTQRDSNALKQSNEFGDADGKYGYGVAGANGYAPTGHASHGEDLKKYGAAAVYAKGAGAADLARLWDQSAQNSLKKSAKDSTKDEGKTSFSKDQWRSDKEQAYNRDQSAEGNDEGFSDWRTEKDASDSGHDAKSANAASQAAASQGRWDLDEAQWNAENRRRNLSDRKANKKVNKKFFANKLNGGDNWERLNYDRDQVDDVFGYKSGVKKDVSNSAREGHANSAYDAAAKKADAARQADSARAYSSDDWEKSQDGFTNEDSHRQEQASADRKGLRNDNYKNQVEQNAYDQDYANSQAWDKAADRYGADKMHYGNNAAYGNQGYNAQRQYQPYIGAGALNRGYGNNGYSNGYGAATGYGHGNAGYGNGYGNAGYGNAGYGY